MEELTTIDEDRLFEIASHMVIDQEAATVRDHLKLSNQGDIEANRQQVRLRLWLENGTIDIAGIQLSIHSAPALSNGGDAGF
nr:hypothetical protein [uncultured Roseateles sp.]